MSLARNWWAQEQRKRKQIPIFILVDTSAKTNALRLIVIVKAGILPHVEINVIESVFAVGYRL